MKFTLGRAVTAATLLLALSFTPCFGQDGERGNRGDRGGRPGQGGGRGGFGGGFGGGMMGGGMMGGPRGDMMLLTLLRIDEVKKEVDLMPDQEEAVGKVGEKLRETRPPQADFDFREATEEQRNAFMEKMRAFGEEQGKKVTEQLEEILLPEQLDRLREIALQNQGVQAFYDPSFAKKIGLSDSQQEKLKKMQEESNTKMREEMMEAFQAARESGDRSAMATKMQELRDKQMEDAKGVLTDEQKKKYKEMLGEPFEMPEGAMRGGFGGPGAGPGGPGGRGGRGGRGGDRGNDA